MLETVEDVSVAKVADDQRMAFLPKHFGGEFLRFEVFGYHWLSSLSRDYRGGYWHYYEASNGAVFMAPAEPPVLQFSCDNGFAGTLTAEAAGIVASLYALNWLCWDQNPSQDRMTELYYRLRDVALEHRERDLILRALD